MGQSIATQESEDLINSHWPELPSIPLENIYSFLKRKDQVNMSLVCRNWSEGYGLPSVWKKFNFDLTKSQLSMDTCPVMKFVRKYSSMFRHVEVEYRFLGDQRLFEIWSRPFMEFLQILTDNSQLKSINFGFFVFPIHIDYSTYDDVCTAIANFLESQHHLKQVKFRWSFFRLHECVEILRKLILHNRKSLRQLDILYFVRCDPIAEEQNLNLWQNIPTITDFPNLTILETDYSLIFEKMVSLQRQTVKNCQILPLSKIILDYVNINRERFRGLTARDWQFLKKLSPNLQVELSISTNSPSRQELAFVILPHMPIARLRYECEESHIRMENEELFRHLLECKTNDHLVYLDLFWESPVQDLVSLLNPFLSACRKLKYLDVSVNYPSNILDLMEYWLNNRLEYLEKVIIRILNADVEDHETLVTLQTSTSECVSRLELIGMNVQVEFL